MLPSERSKSFQRLFGTERCEQIYTACLNTINRLSSDFDEGLSESDSILSNLQLTKASIQEIDSRLQSIADDIPPKSCIEEMEKCIKDFERSQDIEQRIIKIQSVIEQCEPKTAAEREALGKWESVLFEAEKQAEKIAPEAKRVVSNLQIFELWESSVKEKDELQLLLKNNESTLQKLETAEPKPPAIAEPEAYKEASIEAEIKSIKVLLEAIDPETGEGECPVCKTPGTELREYAETSAIRLDKLTEDLQSIREIRQEWDQWDAAHTTWKEKKQSATNTRDQLAMSISRLKAPQKPSGTVEEWKKTEVTFSKLQTQITYARKVVSDQKALLDTATGTLAAYRQELAAAEKESAGLKFDVDSVAAATEQLEEIKKLSMEQAEIRGELRALEDAEKRLTIALEKLEKARKAHGRRIKLTESLTRVREAFHRDGVPAKVSRAYLRALTEGSDGYLSVNELLEIFDAPFRVEVREDDLSFLAHFDAGHVQPAERLSGGEKVVLALALRTSINALFASDLSMMFLDEPTEYLDEANISCLHVALERLGQLAEDRGMQVIVITHEQELAPLFDKVIELGVN